MHSAAMDVCDGGREAGGIAMEGKKAPNKQERVGDFLKSLEIHSSIVLQEHRQMEPIKLEGIGFAFKISYEIFKADRHLPSTSLPHCIYSPPSPFIAIDIQPTSTREWRGE